MLTDERLIRLAGMIQATYPFTQGLMDQLNLHCVGAAGFVNVDALGEPGMEGDPLLDPIFLAMFGRWQPGDKLETTSWFHAVAKAAAMLLQAAKYGLPIDELLIMPTPETAELYALAGGVIIVDNSGTAYWAAISKFAQPWDVAFAIIKLWHFMRREIKIVHADGARTGDVELGISVATSMFPLLSGWLVQAFEDIDFIHTHRKAGDKSLLVLHIIDSRVPDRQRLFNLRLMCHPDQVQ